MKKKECVEIIGTQLKRLPSHQNNLKAFSEKTGKKKNLHHLNDNFLLSLHQGLSILHQS